MEHVIPQLSGLILTGGRSSRMGIDKCFIKWHGKEQCYYLAELLKECCREVFISCREDQQEKFDTAYDVLPDAFHGIGPLAGVLTAFFKRPASAWLIVACDLPLIDAVTVQFLLGKRNENKIATAFANPYDGLPEPMLTVWEPASLPVLQESLGKGISSLRRILLQSAVALIEPPHPASFVNVNTPAEMENVMKMIAGKK